MTCMHEMCWGKMGMTTFSTKNESVFLLFIFSLIMLVFGLWLSFVATDEIINNFPRRPPFGDATGPITIILFGWLAWSSAPLPHNVTSHTIVLSPSGLRYGAMSVHWSEITAIRENSLMGARLMELTLDDPIAHWARKESWFLRRFGNAKSIQISDRYINGSLDDLIAQTDSYWCKYRDRKIP